MKRYFRALCVCVTLTLLFTGCTPAPKNEISQIKVMYYNAESLDSDYGNIFRAAHPDINLEVVATTGTSVFTPEGREAFKKLLGTEKPDVLFLDSEQYEDLSTEGKLLALDTLIKQGKYSLESMHQGVMEVLRKLGNGQLYGLAPTFTSSALFYNKDLFKQFNLDYPTDQMTWEQVIKLAERFPNTDQNGERIYGLTLQPWDSTPYGLLNRVNATAGLNEVDKVGMKLMMNTAQQRNNVEMVIEPFKKGVIQYADVSGNLGGKYIDEMPFVNGKSAMYLGDANFFSLIGSAISNNNSGINWDIVTEPIDPRSPETSTSFALDTIFSISADSPNQEAAFEFIKFINSEEVAKLKSKSTTSLLSRTGVVKERNGHSMEAFYKLKFPQPAQISETIPTSFLREYRLLKNQQFQDVLDNKKSVEEALDIIQKEGQSLLEFSLSQETKE